MDTPLTHAARIELACSVRRRYQAASSRVKKQILSEFVAISGYHPKYAIHVLNAVNPMAPVRRERVRPTLHDDAAKQVLIVLWEASGRVCGKRLKPLLKILLPALERHGHLKLDEAIRSKVLWSSQDFMDTLKRRAETGGRSSVQAIYPVGYTTDIRVHKGTSREIRHQVDVRSPRSHP